MAAFYRGFVEIIIGGQHRWTVVDLQGNRVQSGVSDTDLDASAAAAWVIDTLQRCLPR